MRRDTKTEYWCADLPILLVDRPEHHAIRALVNFIQALVPAKESTPIPQHYFCIWHRSSRARGGDPRKDADDPVSIEYIWHVRGMRIVSALARLLRPILSVTAQRTRLCNIGHWNLIQ